jgi:hypothetical protein
VLSLPNRASITHHPIQGASAPIVS